ncbi:ER lumen protein retaining receptor [Piptocephalis cylindrospora]|uniref:ER lumen protein-retaining receptor n=1 Tax=Piptocephalis cylindrospora TaxID=1907219 RepID=A0A4P9Y5F9_9FUNG|nr:ER lumen protein retaining receptor [Piptocephalis cylindrospora]|eukprot:RKP13952.1 ER lumen protein retaining receptor [Piptocephalis cylindrospora]
MNIFRLVADLLHLASIVILLIKMYATNSCSGISFKTQVLYLAVFIARYLDVFWHFVSVYNTFMKVFFIATASGVVWAMLGPLKDSRSKSLDTFRWEFIVAPSALLAIIFHDRFTVTEIFWSFSVFLEAVAILPQLHLLQQSGEAETITTHYLAALGGYRALYLVNWIYRYFTEGYVDVIAWCAGLVQTALYCDFFYVYFTRVLQGRRFALPV